MPAETKPASQPEIAHILCTDTASLIGGLADAAKGEVTLENLKKGVVEAASILKPTEEEKIPEQIRAFHKEFEDLLRTAKIKKLVVLIDDQRTIAA